jgi:hypothetical protein
VTYYHGRVKGWPGGFLDRTSSAAPKTAVLKQVSPDTNRPRLWGRPNGDIGVEFEFQSAEGQHQLFAGQCQRRRLLRRQLIKGFCVDTEVLPAAAGPWPLPSLVVICVAWLWLARTAELVERRPVAGVLTSAGQP